MNASRLVHCLNAFAWFANAICWAFYAHVAFLAIASLAACVTAIYLARAE